VDETLYRFYDADDMLLYVGISDDWTRRLRQHWRDKPWFGDVISVTREPYPDRGAVSAAERAAIRAERPLYNKQHNGYALAADEPGTALSPEDIIAAGMLILAAGYMLYTLSQAAIAKYRAWKADHDEFRAWQRARPAEDHAPSSQASPPLAVTSVKPVPLPEAIGYAALFAYFTSNQGRKPNKDESAAPSA
jgi:hypothetical protein